MAIHHTEIDAWYAKHAHPEIEYEGAIGGRFSTLTMSTSIGDIRHICCALCREEAFVDDDL